MGKCVCIALAWFLGFVHVGRGLVLRAGLGLGWWREIRAFGGCLGAKRR